jgi:hypothetical protein
MRGVYFSGPLVLWAMACARSGAEAAPPDTGPSHTSPAFTETGAGDANGLAAREASASWQGSYRSRPGTLYIPADWKNVRWAVPESTLGLGDGAMRLTVGRTGRVQGVVEGPLGPAVVAGLAIDGGLSANVLREHPDDRGFAGVLTGSIASGHIEGTMHVSSAQADAIRVATFTLGTDGAGR